MGTFQVCDTIATTLRCLVEANAATINLPFKFTSLLVTSSDLIIIESHNAWCMHSDTCVYPPSREFGMLRVIIIMLQLNNWRRGRGWRHIWPLTT